MLDLLENVTHLSRSSTLVISLSTIFVENQERMTLNTTTKCEWPSLRYSLEIPPGTSQKNIYKGNWFHCWSGKQLNMCYYKIIGAIIWNNKIFTERSIFRPKQISTFTNLWECWKWLKDLCTSDVRFWYGINCTPCHVECDLENYVKISKGCSSLRKANRSEAGDILHGPTRPTKHRCTKQ